MNPFIELHTTDGEDVLVNVNRILYVAQSGKGSHLQFGDGTAGPATDGVSGMSVAEHFDFVVDSIAEAFNPPGEEAR